MSEKSMSFLQNNSMIDEAVCYSEIFLIELCILY